jgi:hypothetical protein
MSTPQLASAMQAVESRAVASVESSTRPLNEKGANTTNTGTRNRRCSLCAPASNSIPIASALRTGGQRRQLKRHYE